MEWDWSLGLELTSTHRRYLPSRLSRRRDMGLTAWVGEPDGRAKWWFEAGPVVKVAKEQPGKNSAVPPFAIVGNIARDI